MSILTDTASPFEVAADAAADDALQSVRQRMERTQHSTGSLSYCSFHSAECSEQQRSVFLLHRDVICALLLPLFEIHNQATQIATRVLGKRQGAEPERAFRGEARGAFTWLHSILTEERDFCLAEGCPACVVLHVLSSEPTIRLVAVACMLCDFVSGPDFAGIKKSRRPPDFGFWLTAMEKAVREDPLWGEAFWPEIQHRSESLAVDIKYLITQCAGLRNGTESQQTTLSNHRNNNNNNNSNSNNNNHNNKSTCSLTTRTERQAYRVHVRSIPAQPSALARRQLNMVWEEQELVAKYLQTCWNSLCWSDRRQKMLEFSKTGALYLPREGTI